MRRVPCFAEARVEGRLQCELVVGRDENKEIERKWGDP